MLSLQGPRARDILEKICDADFSNKSFPFSSHKLVTIAGHEVISYVAYCLFGSNLGRESPPGSDG